MRPCRAVVDACVWISAFAPSEVDHFKARAFVDEIARGRHRIHLPWPVIAEVVCRLAARFRQNRVDPESAMIVGDGILALPNIRMIDVDKAVAYDAARLGARYRLRGMDALIAQTALGNRCELITTDNDFIKSAIGERIRIRMLE